ncbi:hypothetical protein CYMTET_28389 [Cymbomonas tetramitiformis]|uniref:RanBP2-type domain-containing protein n=1 Tax=Cymbomonas tetramitiformis TaxID=36881 RepID=A0AAE0FN11_9CHLO|nr:hypothetical protein CYMTET_28389 [Cymbomonas tetramitiformis]
MTSPTCATSWKEMHMDAKVPTGLLQIQHTYSLCRNGPKPCQLRSSTPEPVSLWSYDAASGIIITTRSSDPDKPHQVFAEEECATIEGGFPPKSMSYHRLSAAPEGEHGDTDEARRTWAFDGSGRMSLRADGRIVHVPEASDDMIWAGITENNVGQENLQKVVEISLSPTSEPKAQSTMDTIIQGALNAAASVDSAITAAASGENWGPDGRYGWDHNYEYWKFSMCEMTNEGKNKKCYGCNIGPRPILPRHNNGPEDQ